EPAAALTLLGYALLLAEVIFTVGLGGILGRGLLCFPQGLLKRRVTHLGLTQLLLQTLLQRGVDIHLFSLPTAADQGRRDRHGDGLATCPQPFAHPLQVDEAGSFHSIHPSVSHARSI